MQNKISHIYRLPLFLSVTFIIAMIALRVERNVLNIFQIVLGGITGTFLLDLDYLLHAYFIDPTSQMSKNMASYIKHRDFGGFLRFSQEHKHDILDKTLNSALFQVVLAGAAIFVVWSSTNLFMKALMLSTLLNSLYRFCEAVLEGKTAVWFWSLKINQSKLSIYSYGIGLFILFLVLLSFA